MTRCDGRPCGPGPVRIAVDLLGGDTPAVVVDGAPQARGTDPNSHIAFFALVGTSPVAGGVSRTLIRDSIGDIGGDAGRTVRG